MLHNLKILQIYNLSYASYRVNKTQISVAIPERNKVSAIKYFNKISNVVEKKPEC